MESCLLWHVFDIPIISFSLKHNILETGCSFFHRKVQSYKMCFLGPVGEAHVSPDNISCSLGMQTVNMKQ